MANNHGSSAALLAVLLCSTPLLAQQNSADTPPATPPPPAAPTSAEAVQADSGPGVRIVRLSEVKGAAQMDRRTDHGFEPAFANLPITQGARLRTEEGVAEVEFEDNSTLRLTPNTLVEFPVLSRGRDGARSSTVRVLQGAVYVSLTKDKANDFNVTFRDQTLALAPAAHIQLAVGPGQPRLDVMDGSVQATNGATTTTVPRKKALLFDATNASAPTLVGKVEKGPYDEWDKQSVEYHKRYAANSNFASSPYAYGTADMNYYGSFSSFGQCGNMWRPYLVSANWSPYSNGVWAWYSGGAGYSWVSPYPWGWLPYHSGSWAYCPTGGWGWRPNNQWNGLRNTAAATDPAPVKTLRGPSQLKPPLPPTRLQPGLVVVHDTPLVASKLGAQDTFVFRNNSAGLGVPRGTFGKLGGISASAIKNGVAERPVYYPSASPASQGPGYAGQLGANHTTAIGARSLGADRGRALGTTGNAIGSPRFSPSMSSGAGRSLSPGGSFGGGAGAGGGAPRSMPSGGGPSVGHH